MPTAEYWVDQSRRIASAKRGQKARLVQEEAAKIGVSPQRFWRELGKHGYNSNRAPRSDRGTSEATVDELKAVIGYMWSHNRMNGKQIMFLPQAIEILKVNGELREHITESIIRRGLAARGWSFKEMRQPAPVQQLRSLHPNHVHQIDPSVCTLYYLGKNARFEWMSEGEYYKNKPANQERAREGMLWRYVLTDHYTGYIDVFYIQSPGESWSDYFNALMWFWAERKHTPFHGVPLHLMSDRIGAMKTGEIQSLLKELGVKHIVAQGARAKGQVEGANNLIETHFENRLKGMLVGTVKQLNAHAADWCQWFNATKVHSRHGHKRTDLWVRDIGGHLRILPELKVCRLLCEPKPKERTVSQNLCISFENRTYRLRHLKDIDVGDKLQVRPAPFSPGDVYVTRTDLEGKEHKYQLSPLEHDAAGFTADAAVIGDEHHKSAPDTPRETLKKELAKDAYGTDTLKDAEAAAKQNHPLYDQRIDPMKDVKDQRPAEYIRKKGTPIKPEAPEPRSSLFQSMQALARKLGRPLTHAEGDDLRARFEEGMTDGEIEQEAARMLGARPKLTVVK